MKGKWRDVKKKTAHLFGGRLKGKCFGNISSFLLFFICSGSSGVVLYQRDHMTTTLCSVWHWCWTKQCKSENPDGIHVCMLLIFCCRPGFSFFLTMCFRNETPCSITVPWNPQDVGLFCPQLCLSCSIPPSTSSTTQMLMFKSKGHGLACQTLCICAWLERKCWPVSGQGSPRYLNSYKNEESCCINLSCLYLSDCTVGSIHLSSVMPCPEIPQRSADISSTIQFRQYRTVRIYGVHCTNCTFWACHLTHNSRAVRNPHTGVMTKIHTLMLQLKNCPVVVNFYHPATALTHLF